MEFPTCVHVTKTTGTMTHGATYVPIEEGKSVRAENAKLRELVRVMAYCMQQVRDCDGCAANGADGVVTAPSGCDWLRDHMRELGVVE